MEKDDIARLTVLADSRKGALNVLLGRVVVDPVIHKDQHILRLESLIIL